MAALRLSVLCPHCPAHAEDTQYLRVFIGQPRAKLEPDPAEPRHILTQPGIGYRFMADEHA